MSHAVLVSWRSSLVLWVALLGVSSSCKTSTPTEEPTSRGNGGPVLQPGNQTDPGARALEFDRYVAQMHRPIHEVWAWGVLERLEAEERSHPLNDRDLWTRVEIVVGSEGRIENVTTIRFSGDAGFDEVARLSVHASGPYPTPPEGIRSGNGKVYVHWTFHRDERACGTSGNATIHH